MDYADNLTSTFWTADWILPWIKRQDPVF